MAILHQECPVCLRDVHLISSEKCDDFDINEMSCGHSIIIEKLALTHDDKLDAISWIDDNGVTQRLRPFQKEDIRRAEQVNFRCLFNWEQALGKTIAGASIIKLHPELTPTIIFCKGLLKFQWFKKILEITGEVAQVFESGKEKPYLGFKILIISQDLARNLDWLREYKKKLVIIDEIQNIKSNTSDRTNAIRRACVNADHVIEMSGTPIANHAGEYFPGLNILYPDRFYQYENFIQRHVAWSPNGLKGRKLGGLRYPKQFYEMTKDYIFVREKKDVWKDLPSINRMFNYVDLGNLSDAYARAYDEFKEAYADMEDPDSAFNNMASSIIVIMNKMKHITGQAKILPAIDFVDEFMESHSSDNAKITIGVHHHDVANLLARGIGDKYGPLTVVTGETPSAERYDKVQAFAKDVNKRVCIAGIQAVGEGIDGLQTCSNVLVVERQWNAMREEQFETRFPRPGAIAKVIDITYLNVLGTIDELLSSMIEKKRAIGRELKDKGETTDYNESPAMRELASILASNDRKAFSL